MQGRMTVSHPPAPLLPGTTTTHSNRQSRIRHTQLVHMHTLNLARNASKASVQPSASGLVTSKPAAASRSAAAPRCALRNEVYTCAVSDRRTRRLWPSWVFTCRSRVAAAVPREQATLSPRRNNTQLQHLRPVDGWRVSQSLFNSHSHRKSHKKQSTPTSKPACAPNALPSASPVTRPALCVHHHFAVSFKLVRRPPL